MSAKHKRHEIAAFERVEIDHTLLQSTRRQCFSPAGQRNQPGNFRKSLRHLQLTRDTPQQTSAIASITLETWKSAEAE
jgi:hypothetical protein